MASGEFKVFGEQDADDYLKRRLDEVAADIQRRPESYIVGVDEEQYVAALVERARFVNLDLRFDEVEAEPFEADVPAERFPSALYFVERGRTYKKPAFRFRIPISGDEVLLRLRPNPRQSWHPAMFIDGGCLCIELVCFENTTEKVNRDFEQIERELTGNLAHLRANVEAHNTLAESVIRSRFRARREQFQKHDALAAGLSVPIRRRGDVPAAFTVPAPERRTKIAPMPDVKPSGGKPDPVLDQTVYEQILTVIHEVGKQFERMPSTYAGKDEEGLRDLLLMPLESNFVGTATGETFNKKGKTDILLRYDGSNIFVAECKFWGGQKELLAAVTQLLGYLTWRDSKAALVVFVRNKDFSSVIETVKAALPSHANFLRTTPVSGETWLNYRVHLPGDRGREVRLAVLLFHMP